MINLFEQTAEPIAITRARYEYRIVPDVAYPDGMEVYSVDQVTSVDPIAGETTEYLPFYSLRHGTTLERARDFWYAVRRPSTRPNDRGTEVYLSLVNLGFDPTRPADPTLVVRTTCTNRELPATLQQAGERLIFDLEAAAPLSRIRCVQSPSLPLRPPLRRGSYWRLISHLCLNHLSLADATEGRESLQEILRLYDVSDPGADKQRAMVTRQLIEGIVSVSSRRVTGRLPGAGIEGLLPRHGSHDRIRRAEVRRQRRLPVRIGAGAFPRIVHDDQCVHTTGRQDHTRRRAAEDMAGEGGGPTTDLGAAADAAGEGPAEPRAEGESADRRGPMQRRHGSNRRRRSLHRLRRPGAAQGRARDRVAAGRGAAALAVAPASTPTEPDGPPPATRPTPLHRRSLARRLFEESYNFDFFQAVRLLQRMEPGRALVGRGGPPQAEAVRFRARISLSFPPSSIYEIRRPTSSLPVPVMVQAFMGLTGPSGVLPRHYTELLYKIERDVRTPEKHALRDWFDLFNHRLVSLFYRAWEKYRFYVPFERGEYDGPEPDPFTNCAVQPDRAGP